ncbi:hypothetical protein BLS_009181 [Venturia inaequalis]|uniref:DUF7907 domain-containing protein n=1 Tax=Venturia inaequalis TaxID=5025 RepID=A0A8H3VVS7_VENIN|nr:hypothetical protein BLS_009181 [Venturia inaequalis]KAE9980328.1 hypothetical protein EG328_000356 [Venturia inaequalis]KAE9994708.1 hypothetical protein EG327_005154 [Venturia inaequalis]RDI79608.1 hypothetical protein Vi05172_g10525 [Venturia inaequalis]
MKLTSFLLGAFALVATAVAQQTPTVKSEPFNIIVLAANPAYNGTYLSGLRAGPFVNKMTFSKTTFTSKPYYLNTTQGSKYGGHLCSDYTGSTSAGNLTIPLNFRVEGDLSTNLASTWMSVTGKATDGVEFSQDGLMGLHVGGHDDAKMPDPKLVMAGPKVLCRWVACKEFGPYGGIMDTLMWVSGGKPQNPTCYDVSLKRI